MRRKAPDVLKRLELRIKHGVAKPSPLYEALRRNPPPPMPRARKQLREIPADRRSTSKLANEVAVLLKELGRLGEALPLMRQCLAGAKIKYGAQERQTLACMHNLGELHHLRWLCKDGDGLQELQNALPLLTEALAGRRKLLGQHDLDTLQTLDMLALVYQDSNNLALAEQHAQGREPLGRR